MKIELSKEELNIIIIGMTGSQYPIQLQKRAFELVYRLRDVLINAES
jgi:hypothetical protein